MFLRHRAYLIESGKYELVIKKQSSGSNRWWIHKLTKEWPHDQSVRGFKTKKEATAFLGAVQGDKAAARKWYRLAVVRKIKDKYVYRTKEEAWKDTAFTAHQHGMTSAYVHADPDTFEPL